LWAVCEDVLVVAHVSSYAAPPAVSTVKLTLTHGVRARTLFALAFIQERAANVHVWTPGWLMLLQLPAVDE